MGILASLKHYLKPAFWACKELLWRMSPSVFERLSHPYAHESFSIGIYSGQACLDLRDPSDVRNPVLSYNDVTDVPAAFVADPFMINREGRWYMFFEVLNRAAACYGQIGLATSPDGRRWSYERIVLSERFHLAYPYVFAWRDDVYMIPDSPGNGVRLYRARAFPGGWELVKVIIEGGEFIDSSPFFFADRWWLLTYWSQHASDTRSLRLFFADEPTGVWSHCRMDPILEDTNRKARPAGRVQILNNRLVRFAQDGVPTYGTSVRAFEITKLTVDAYEERELSPTPILTGTGRGWNAMGMHHVDAHRLQDGSWLACVDGWEGHRKIGGSGRASERG